MKWLPVWLLWVCASAWAYPPMFQADVPDPEAVTCLYENSTAGHVEQFPVTVSTERGNSAFGYRVCLRSALDWPVGPNSVRLATRAADGRTTDYTAAVLPRPSGSVASARLFRDVAAPPPPPPPPSTPMAAYASKGINNTSTGTSLTVPYPASISAGDFLLVNMVLWENSGEASALANNASFNVIHNEHISIGGSFYHWIIAWKRAAGGESGSATFSWTGSVGFAEGSMSRFTGVYATGTPFQFAAGDLTDTSSHVAPSIDSTYSNSLWVLLAINEDYAAWSTASGFTEHFDGGTSQLGTIQSKALSAAGATGTATTSSSASAGRAASLLLFDTTPAGGGGSTYNESVSETATASDSSSTTATRAGALAEAGSATDTNAATMVRAGSLTEAGSAADAPVGVVMVARSVSEAGSATDAITGLVTASRAVTESASAADSQAAIMTRAGAVTEAASAEGAESAALQAAAAVSEAASAGDTVTTGAAAYEVTISEAASAADAVSTIAARVASMSEALSAADAFTVTAVYGAAQSETASASDATNWSGALYSTDIAETATLEDAVSSALQALAAIAEAGDAADAPTVIISAGVSVLEPASAADALSTALQITALLSEPASAADTVLVQPDGTIDVGIEEAATALDEYVAVLIDGFLVITAPPRRTLTSGASRPANLSAAYRPRNLPGRGR